MPLGGAIVARTTARATGELALTKRTGYTSWANVAERGRGQAGRFGRGDAPGESGPQGPSATTHTGATHMPQPRRPPRAPQPGENRLHPLATELYRRDTAAVSRALGRPYLAAWVRI